MGSQGRGEMVMTARRVVVVAALAWLASVNCSRDVEQFYDDIGPANLDGDGANLDFSWRSRGPRDSGLGESKGEKESWNCRESRRCKCAEAMLERGVELEDLRLLDEEAFSREDELVFLQVATSPTDLAKEAAQFSGYSWKDEDTVRKENSAPSMSQKQFHEKAKEYLGASNDMQLDSKSSSKQVVARTNSMLQGRLRQIRLPRRILRSLPLLPKASTGP